MPAPVLWPGSPEELLTYRNECSAEDDIFVEVEPGQGRVQQFCVLPWLWPVCLSRFKGLKQAEDTAPTGKGADGSQPPVPCLRTRQGTRRTRRAQHTFRHRGQPKNKGPFKKFLYPEVKTGFWQPMPRQKNLTAPRKSQPPSCGGMDDADVPSGITTLSLRQKMQGLDSL